MKSAEMMSNTSEFYNDSILIPFTEVEMEMGMGIGMESKKNPIKKTVKRKIRNDKISKTTSEFINNDDITKDIKETIDNDFQHSKQIEKLEEEIKNAISLNIETEFQKDYLLDHLGNYNDEPYQIIESYFDGKHLERLVRHQIESYNHFINYQIQRTIQMFNPVVIRSENDFVEDKNKYLLEIFINFNNFKLYPPQIHENNGATKIMLPKEAKLRNFTYASTMTLDLNIKYSIRNTEKMETPRIIEKTLSKINIGKLPIMVKSSICVLTQNKHIDSIATGECQMDCGGYFIIKGSEKTVLGQERSPENRVNCFDGKNTTKWNWVSEIKSVPDFKCISPKQIEMMISSKNNGFGNGIYISVPRIKQPIELFVLFRAYGILSDKEICQYILLDVEDDKQSELMECLKASIVDSNKYMTQEDAIKHMTSYVAYTPLNMDKDTGIKKKRDFTMEILENDVLPHCKTLPQKLYLLGHMTKKLIQTSIGWFQPVDRDSYINKRIDLTGTLLNNLFRNYFNKLVKEMQKQIVREINTGSWRSSEDYENIINMTNIYKIMKSTTIENGINRALATGDFSIKQSNSSKVGVAQVLNRLTYVSSLSHLRRINTPIEKSGELIPPRKLHNTTWGFLCLTGDTDVLLADKINSKKIKDIKDGDWVNTVNRQTLMDEPSDMNHFFSRMPDKLFEITTISGRKIKATADHPFLTRPLYGENKYEMKKVGDMNLNDKIIIHHMVKSIPDENRTVVIINETDVLEQHRAGLLEKGLLNQPIPIEKLKLIARIIGVIIYKMIQYSNQSWFIKFDDEKDANQLLNDIRVLGFNDIYITYKEFTGWTISTTELFSYFTDLIRTDNMKMENYNNETLTLPKWLMEAELSIKREFLSTICGMNITLRYNQSDKTRYISFKGNTDDDENTIVEKCTIKIIILFKEFNIQCGTYRRFYTPHADDIDEDYYLEKSPRYQGIVFNRDTDNLIRFLDTFNHVYSFKKRLLYAGSIEYLKIKSQNIVIDDKFISENYMDNGCISVPILSIKEIEPELVYDFTTTSDNHSFVASSFVSSNCPAETPEGQSIGIVKNISYMAHITIPTNSSSLYEYVQPYILAVETTESKMMNNKVKVFVNGVFLGVAINPVELYNEMKNKKYKGIINIYTSIIFDYKTMEIRICNDGGRLTRPVLKVRDNKALITMDIIKKLENKEITWNDLLTDCKLEESVIEYIDPEEQNYSMIAMKSKNTYLQKKDLKINYTHSEIHPSTIFGVLASCVPFPDHNQAPRNTYQCLHPDELVWMSDGTKKPIKDVIIGDNVLTFHPETLDISKTSVINQFVRKNEHDIYRIRTISGREIVATEDHRFMTDQGWKTVKEMILNSDIKIGISMNKNISFKMEEYLKVKELFSNKKEEIINIEIWLNKYTYEKNNCLFIPIEIISKEPDGLISCIETESMNHSFMAGESGFLSSNCAMSKQSMGVYAKNFDQRMDKTAYVLTYPSRPLVDTRIMNLLQLNQIPSGSQIHVAIMTHSGYNQEDSVLINKGSIDRGMFLTTIYHTEKDEDKNIIRDEIIRCKPDTTKTKCIKFGNYDKLNSQGFIEENELVENRDVIIAKIIPIKENRNDPTKTIKYEDQSKTFRTTEETYIDKNYTGRNGDGYNFAKVRVRTLRKPVIGDKFACSLPTQQVLTHLGWVEMKDIDISLHKVATLDINGKMCYEHPVNKFEYDHSGEMYSVENKQVKMICTLNHKLYVQKRHGKKYEQIEASNVMGKMCRFQKSLDNVYPDIENIILGDKKYKMDDWLQLLGMFISDGSTNSCAVYLSCFKERKIDFNTNLLTKLGIEIKYNSNNGVFAINKGKYPEIYEELNKYSVGAANKYLPEYTWNLSKRQCIILLESLIQGDGNVMTSPKGKTDFNRYYTISMRLANDVSRLAVHCGWSGIIKLKEEANNIEHTATTTMGYRAGQTTSIIHKNDYYMISIIKLQNQPWINKKHNDSNVEELIEYNGKVYCIEMPSSNLYYFRENNFAASMLSGNSRAAQKGTVGNIIPECDMPFTKEGLRPDIIINPHAIPSRMTIGQLKETLLGKVLIELGMFGDGTSFGNLDIKTISNELQRLGYESYGNEVMYSGLTGEQLETTVFFGPVFYQRLKHMVNDKQHSRSIGPMVNLTRQPAEGRSRDGGFRVGEMERDVLIAHGISRFCRERLFDVSDKYSVHVCKKCGMIASYNDGNKNKSYLKSDFTIHLCKTCNNKTDFALVEVPYSYKLLSQELQTINVVPRLIVD
jgi:DNA-directed RNA polymerase beta subunit